MEETYEVHACPKNSPRKDMDPSRSLKKSQKAHTDCNYPKDGQSTVSSMRGFCPPTTNQSSIVNNRQTHRHLRSSTMKNNTKWRRSEPIANEAGECNF